MPIIWVASFYKFVALPDFESLRALYLEQAQAAQLKGSILLATEGINATLSGEETLLAGFLQFLRSDSRLAELEVKYSQALEQPFQRLKIRLKREIVTLGQAVDPREQVGTYVQPQDWNALIQEEDLIVIDTRNQYETEIGSFEGALDPQLERFQDFTDYVQTQLDPEKNPRIAMFCTGGIRCEKASSWMLQQGFKEVYHLEGGILKYLETVPAEDSLWHGQCFVFDERVAVDHDLESGDYQMCLGCGRPVSGDGLKAPEFEPGVSCRHCFALRSAEQKLRSRQSWAEKQRQAQVSLQNRRSVPQ